jgi:hypothetical protein
MRSRQVYYAVKPYMPASVRLTLRRWLAGWKRKRHSAVWPIWPNSERPPAGWLGWPEGKKFAFVLTHDVENQSGFDKCAELMDVEGELGFRSSFNLIPEGEYRVNQAIRQHLEGHGFEVGVHDLEHDGRLFDDHQSFKAKARRINEYIKEWGASGFRAGFMFHNLEWFSDLNVQYDASTFDTDPFEPQPDGVGTIFPFWVGARREQDNGIARKGFVELPYTLVQDSTLFLHLRERDTSVWKRKLDWIAQNGGMALLDTHPDYMCFSGSCNPLEYPVTLYQEFLTYVREKYSGQYWAPLPRVLAQWYQNQNSIQPGFPVQSFPGQNLSKSI